MALGSPCTMSGSDVECDGNDTICMQMAREGQAPALMCTCKMGFHMTGAPPVCEAGVCWCILHSFIFFKIFLYLKIIINCCCCCCCCVVVFWEEDLPFYGPFLHFSSIWSFSVLNWCFKVVKTRAVSAAILCRTICLWCSKRGRHV